MRISDWSSDVCSSDLAAVEGGEALPQRDLQFLFEIAPQARIGLIAARETGERTAEAADRFRKKPLLIPVGHAGQIGRASGRERGWQYVLISVVAGSLKKNNKIKHTETTTNKTQ